MSRIKIEDVREELKQIGWTLISEEYKNLDTDLEMMCPEHHKVFMPLKKWRKHAQCPTCESAHIVKNLAKSAPKKKMGTTRVLALDDATGTTGYAIFDGDSLIKYGKITIQGNDAIERILELKQWLVSMLDNWTPDIVAIEDIQLQQGRFENVKTYKVLAQLQGVLLTTLLENSIEYYVIPPATWRSTCSITARTRADQKRQAQQRVESWYDIKATQDEADAICIGYHVMMKIIKSNTLLSWE